MTFKPGGAKMNVLQRLSNWLWKNPPGVLDGLPEYKEGSPCRKCGSIDYNVWNQFQGTHWLTPDPVECDRCSPEKMPTLGVPVVEAHRRAPDKERKD